MRIGIIGTRGIPNHYGGFEQFAEYFAAGMVARGHEVYVYCSHRHSYKADEYEGVRLVHCHDPEHRIGTSGQFIYDLNCIWHSRKQNYDLILQLGYTSSTVWSWLFPRRALLVTNMDGLEWSRAKYGKLTQAFLKKAEKWGVRYSDKLIADNKGIQEYLMKKYKAASVFVPYGARPYEPEENAVAALEPYELRPEGYDILIARFEPENNIETVLKAYAHHTGCKLLLIGNHSRNEFGRRLYGEYGRYEHIIFAGAVYDMDRLNALRYYSRMYIHGHSAGGTNPSLLEAMASQALICAHDNIFNRNVLEDDAFYFSDTTSLASLLSDTDIVRHKEQKVLSNKHKIRELYQWDMIIDTLETCFYKWKNSEQQLAGSSVA